jgi:hypothetical protein
MTETRDGRVRRAVCEIVDRAPLAPTVDDLAGRSAPRPRRSRLLLPAIALLVVAAAAALTSRLADRVSTDPSTTIEPSTSQPRGSDVTAADAFRILRESQVAAVGNMDTLAGPLIKTCMAAKGFTFTPNSTVLMSVQDESAFLRQRYPEPRQQDGKWGYLFDSGGSAQESQPIEAPPSPSGEVPPGYFEALHGDTIATAVVRDLDGKMVTSNQVGDGCHGQAMATIFGSAQAYLTFFSQLNQLEVIVGSSWGGRHEDPDFVARNRPWAECMKNAGFIYQTILDPQNRDWNSPRPTAGEQQTAAADWQCRQGYHLDGADLLTLEEHALSALLVAHPIGSYAEFELQSQALIAGKFPATDGSTTPPTSTTPGHH